MESSRVTRQYRSKMSPLHDSLGYPIFSDKRRHSRRLDSAVAWPGGVPPLFSLQKKESQSSLGPVHSGTSDPALHPFPSIHFPDGPSVPSSSTICSISSIGASPASLCPSYSALNAYSGSDTSTTDDLNSLPYDDVLASRGHVSAGKPSGLDIYQMGAALAHEYAVNAFPSVSEKKAMAQRHGVTPEEIEQWFMVQRALLERSNAFLTQLPPRC